LQVAIIKLADGFLSLCDLLTVLGVLLISIFILCFFRLSFQLNCVEEKLKKLLDKKEAEEK